MNAALHGAFDPTLVLHEDESLLAVHKPCGVPSQSVDPRREDDVVFRLRQWIAERDGLDPAAVYLGVHQRLDQDTSGVMVFTRSRAANPAIARQFEGRSVEKTYCAVVSGPGLTEIGDRCTLQHRLVRKRGQWVALEGEGRSGKVAKTRLRVVSRSQDRALLRLSIETGRTHQIRAQLAKVGAPVMGDRLYGGAGAPRLMLHASGIALHHPESGARMRIEAPPASTFDAVFRGAFDPFERPLLDLSLRGAWERRFYVRYTRDRPEGAEAYRWVQQDAEGLPGLAIDVVDRWLVVHVYEPSVERHLPALLEAIRPYGFDGVYLKRRPKAANLIGDARDEAYAPSEPIAGIAAPEEFALREYGVRYLVRLHEGLSFGLFADQRENRRRVRAWASGTRVLNLFAYTCGFSVAAAAGGAQETVSVDASRRLLAWGERNFQLNGLHGPQHAFWVGDVFEALGRLRRKGRRFDLVCVDPPTYSRTKRSRWNSGRQWADLIEQLMPIVAPGGRVLACSNDRRMSEDAFRRHVERGAERRGTRVSTQAFRCPTDHPAPLGGEAHLKTLLLVRS